MSEQTIDLKNICDYINKNEETVIGWVVEFFQGKYTPEQVRTIMYESNGTARNAIIKLADEFRALPDKSVEGIKNWYEETDFYVFDLLPWNGAGQFKEKLENVRSALSGCSTLVDFGGGLGTASIWYAQYFDRVVYVDLKGGVTYRFAEFLINKLGITNIQMMGTEEFFDSDVVDAIVALDCFEHIPNLSETFAKLAEHSNIIYHDSTFHSDQYSPQHVYTDELKFINAAAACNFIAQDEFRRYLRRVSLQYRVNNNRLTLDIFPVA